MDRAMRTVAGWMWSTRNSRPIKTTPGMVLNRESRGRMNRACLGKRERRMPSPRPRTKPRATETRV